MTVTYGRDRPGAQAGPGTGYRQGAELIAFSCDLSKYCAEHASRAQTIIDVDMLQFKLIDGMTYIRFVETKNGQEPMHKMQYVVLLEMAWMAQRISFVADTSRQYGVFIVTGDAPYKEGAVLTKVRWKKSDQHIKLTAAELTTWLSFEPLTVNAGRWYEDDQP